MTPPVLLSAANGVATVAAVVEVVVEVGDGALAGREESAAVEAGDEAVAGREESAAVEVEAAVLSGKLVGTAWVCLCSCQMLVREVKIASS